MDEHPVVDSEYQAIMDRIQANQKYKHSQQIRIKRTGQIVNYMYVINDQYVICYPFTGVLDVFYGREIEPIEDEDIGVRLELRYLNDDIDMKKYATFLGVPLVEMSKEELITVCNWLGNELLQCEPYRAMSSKIFKGAK